MGVFFSPSSLHSSAREHVIFFFYVRHGCPTIFFFLIEYTKERERLS